MAPSDITREGGRVREEKEQGSGIRIESGIREDNNTDGDANEALPSDDEDHDKTKSNKAVKKERPEPPDPKMVVHLEAVQEDEAVSDKAGGVAVVSQADNSGDDSPPPPVTPVSVVPVLAKAAIAQDAHHDSDGERARFRNFVLEKLVNRIPRRKTLYSTTFILS